jgi:hypothetical protein
MVAVDILVTWAATAVVSTITPCGAVHRIAAVLARLPVRTRHALHYRGACLALKACFTLAHALPCRRWQEHALTGIHLAPITVRIQLACHSASASASASITSITGTTAEIAAFLSTVFAASVVAVFATSIVAVFAASIVVVFAASAVAVFAASITSITSITAVFAASIVAVFATSIVAVFATSIVVVFAASAVTVFAASITSITGITAVFAASVVAVFAASGVAVFAASVVAVFAASIVAWPRVLGHPSPAVYRRHVSTNTPGIASHRVPTVLTLRPERTSRARLKRLTNVTHKTRTHTVTRALSRHG